MTASSTMAISGPVSSLNESQPLNPAEVSSLNLFDSLLASEREAIEQRRYLWAWNPEKVREVLANIDANAEDIPTIAVDIAYLHSAYLRATDEVVANEVDPDFFAAGHEFGLRMMTGEYPTFVFDAYDKVLEFMREQTRYGTNNIPPAYSRDIVTSAGTIRVGERGLDTTNAVTLKDVMKKMGLIMEASTQGLSRKGLQGESKIESGGLPPSVTLAMILATIALITTLIANNSEGIGKWLAGKESSSPLSGQPASPDDIPQGDGAAGGDAGGPDPLDPSLRLTPTFPVPQITLTPSSTADVVTIDKLQAYFSEQSGGFVVLKSDGSLVEIINETEYVIPGVYGVDGSGNLALVVNSSTGDTLELDQSQWSVDEFGLVIPGYTFNYQSSQWEKIPHKEFGSGPLDQYRSNIIDPADLYNGAYCDFVKRTFPHQFVPGQYKEILMNNYGSRIAYDSATAPNFPPGTVTPFYWKETAGYMEIGEWEYMVIPIQFPNPNPELASNPAFNICIPAIAPVNNPLDVGMNTLPYDAVKFDMFREDIFAPDFQTIPYHYSHGTIYPFIEEAYKQIYGEDVMSVKFSEFVRGNYRALDNTVALFLVKDSNYNK